MPIGVILIAIAIFFAGYVTGVKVTQKKQNKTNVETQNIIVNSPESPVPPKVEETAAAVNSNKPKKSSNAAFDAQLRIALKNAKQQQNNTPVVNTEQPKKNIPWFLVGAMAGEMMDKKREHDRELRELKKTLKDIQENTKNRRY